MSGPRVLLMKLAGRTSAKGNPYLSGWLGKARVVGFKAKEPDKYGNEVWEVYAQAPEDDQQSSTRNAERGQRTWDRSRDASRARQAGEAVVRDAREPRLPKPPAGWLDDSEAAVRDLEGCDR
jgi:hypothetical protein